MFFSFEFELCAHSEFYPGSLVGMQDSVCQWEDYILTKKINEKISYSWNSAQSLGESSVSYSKCWTSWVHLSFKNTEAQCVLSFSRIWGSTISPLLLPAEIMDLSHCSDVINHQMFTFCGRLRPFTIGLVGTKLLKSTDCKSHHSSFYEWINIPNLLLS